MEHLIQLLSFGLPEILPFELKRLFMHMKMAGVATLFWVGLGEASEWYRTNFPSNRNDLV